MLHGNVLGKSSRLLNKSAGLKNMYTVSSEGCSDDFSAVAALPEQWEPKRSGPILANYFTDRERKHNEVSKEILDDAAKVNKGIDDKVRAIAEILSSYIEQSKRDMNGIIESCEKKSSSNFNVRDDAIQKVRQHYSQLTEEISQFKREALCLEKERADQIREVLRKQFQRLIEIGCYQQKDLLHQFDEKIYEVNQQLLSNSRAYADLEAQLHSQADENLVRIRSKLNQLSLGSLKRQSSARPFINKKESHDSPSSQQCIDDISMDNLLTDMQEYFDKCVARSVEAYRSAVVNVYTGFFDKFKNLQMSLNCVGTCKNTEEISGSDMAELQVMIETAIQNLSNTVFSKFNCTHEMLESARSDAFIMQQSLKSLGEQLRSTYSILHDAGHLWDPHLLRLALAQKLTITAVEDMVTNHDITELANEVPFNIALEQLRTCADIEKLQSLEDVLQTMLTKTADLYNQHSQEEIARLNEFMTLPPLMANLLLAEFNLFLERYPKIVPEKPVSVCPSDSPSERRKPGRSIIPRTVLQTTLQEAALMNWQRGFLESIQTNIASVPEELERHARLWIDERTISLTVRYSMKMASHSIRSERIKAAHKARLAELRYHENRLQSHLSAINTFVDKVISQASDCLSFDSPKIYPIKQWVSNVEANITKLNEDTHSSSDSNMEVKRMKMSSYKSQLIRHRNLFENSVEEFIENQKRQVQQCFQAARISNVRFLSEIKLFSQGGRFAAQEAVRFAAAIVRASDLLESSLNNFTEAISHGHMQILAKADLLVSPLLKLVEDFGKPPRRAIEAKKSKARK